MTRKSIVIKWHIEDVQGIAQEKLGKNISDEDAIKVLDSLVRNHNADIGINWGVIESAIEFLINDAVISLS